MISHSCDSDSPDPLLARPPNPQPLLFPLLSSLVTGNIGSACESFTQALLLFRLHQREKSEESPNTLLTRWRIPQSRPPTRTEQRRKTCWRENGLPCISNLYFFLFHCKSDKGHQHQSRTGQKTRQRMMKLQDPNKFATFSHLHQTFATTEQTHVGSHCRD